MLPIIGNSLRRSIFTSAKLNNVSSAATAGHGGGLKMWKMLTFIVALPAVGVCMVNAYVKHQEESHEQPEFVAYEHLRLRNKRFPWGEGNKSLFHNPHVNPLPDGYEHH